MRITHADVWKNRPSEINSFVSNQIHLSFPHLEKNNAKKVLDVACGNGLGVSVPLMREGYEVHSLDKWKASINALAKNARNEGFVPHGTVSNMYRKFPYKSSSFDSSFCFQAIYHGSLDEVEFALSEIKRVTKKGGYFFGTFIPYLIKSDKGKHFFNFTKNNGKIGRIYVQVDEIDPHLTYNLDKNCEYMVPHYYFTKTQLRLVLLKYFRTVSIKEVEREEKCSNILFVRCMV